METKSPFASKTIWGAGLTLVSTLLPVLAPLVGFQVTAGDTAEIVAAITAVGGAVGSMIVVWGRISATKAIK